MTKVSNSIAGLATLALACVPMFAVGTAAFAQPVTVQVGDLDVTTADGAREFNRRTNVAASKFCSDTRRLSENASCRTAVREEVAEKLVAMRSTTTTLAAR